MSAWYRTRGWRAIPLVSLTDIRTLTAVSTCHRGEWIVRPRCMAGAGAGAPRTVRLFINRQRQSMGASWRVVAVQRKYIAHQSGKCPPPRSIWPAPWGNDHRRRRLHQVSPVNVPIHCLLLYEYVVQSISCMVEMGQNEVAESENVVCQCLFEKASQTHALYSYFEAYTLRGLVHGANSPGNSSSILVIPAWANQTCPGTA